MKFRHSFLLLVTGTACAAIACTAKPPSESDPVTGGDGDGNGDGDDGDGDGDLVVGTGGQVNDFDLSKQPTPASCGDGVLDDSEACDDGDLESGDGCFENCLIVEQGFICPAPGEPCIPFAKCGDGKTNFPEQCDDGNSTDGDGCSAFCKTEIGYKCSGDPSSCDATTCGDELVEGAEGCDDGNPVPFDGCDVHCQWEPTCGAPGMADGCSSFCGDGILFGDEACDDGNGVSGDGCSETCEVEEGYSCDVAPCEMIGGECVLRVPAVFRDFLDEHPNFNIGGGSTNSATTGLLEPSLIDGKPAYASPSGQTANLSETDNVESWYIEGTDHSTIVSELVLFSNGNDGFVNRLDNSGTRYVSASMPNAALDGNPLFFPVDDFPFCDEASGVLLNCRLTDTTRNGEIPGPDITGQSTYETNWTLQDPPAEHNHSFTTEVSYWFEYDAASPPVLNFLGDDDLWVFINGKLTLDLGGVHYPAEGTITLDAATIETYDLGLVDGTVYPIHIFHAERNPRGSSFRLTLSGFRAERSLCIPNCGDGIVAGSEECDDGDNDGGHNECQPGCVLSTYCGDGVVNGDEVCDDADPNAPGECSGCRIITVR